MNRIFLLLILSFMGCAGSNRASISKIDIRYKTLSQTVLDSEASGLFYFKLNEAEIFMTSFTQISTEDQPRMIEKRKKIFTGLFVDDRDPYTGRTYARSLCIKNVTTGSVAFESGEGNLWSDCPRSQNLKIAPTPAERLWKACGTTLWELTVKSADMQNLIFSCH